MIQYPINMTHLWGLSWDREHHTPHQSRWTLWKNLSPITHLSSIIFFTHTKYLFIFFQSSSSLLDTRLLIKYTNGSISWHELFIRYNNLDVTGWKIYLLSSSRSSDLSFTVKRQYFSGKYNLPLISPPNVSIDSSIFYFMYISTFFSFVIYMFTVIKDCFFPLINVRLKKLLSNN